MARYGFSGKKLDMKKLILFTMKIFPGPVSRQTLFEIVTMDENADYFLFADGLAELLETGHLIPTEQGLEISSRGAEVAAITEKDLPAALRRSALSEIESRRAQGLRDDCVTVSQRVDGGVLYVDGALTDGAAPLMRLSLLVGSPQQAALLERSFRKNAETLYVKILEFLLEHTEENVR